MDPARIAELVLKYARDRGVDEVEAYVAWGEECSVVLSKRGIESVVTGFDVAIGVRVVKDRRMAIVGAHVTTEEDVRKAVERAIDNLRACPRDDKWVSLAKEVGSTPVTDVIDDRVRESPSTVALDLASRLFEAPSAVSPRATLLEGGASCSFGGKVIANSYTSKPLQFARTSLSAWFSVKVETPRGDGTVWDALFATKLSDIDVDKAISRNVDLAEKVAGAKPVETGVYDVVLTSKVFASILSTLIAPAISALNVQRDRSPLKGKLGQQVLSESLTIVDDGAAPGLFGTSAFDDEGVPTKRKIVFDRGVLTTYLYDSYTAYIEGKKPTGNAVRPNVASPPSPGVTNLLVLPGKGSFEDLVKDVKKGILVVNTIGEWLSNPVNGFMNFTISCGVLIENGELTKPVTGVVVSGNIYDLLSKGLSALGEDVENLANVYAPSVLIRGASVAGK